MSKEKIYVTQSFLPPREEFFSLVERIFDSGVLTNQGPLLQELEARLKEFLGVEHLHFLTNGTLALQLALQSLDMAEGEVITTPFSYVATTSSILWERCTPVFVDIETANFTIDAKKIEAAITPRTRAIMAVHVFGYACDVEAIERIAKKHNLKVIYDGAHAFGSKFHGRSLLDYGDVSTLSFHATKLFHTIEGGACVVRHKHVSDKLDLQKRFGHLGDDHFCLGFNAKASEFQAAMGLANFPHIAEVIEKRKKVSETYDAALGGALQRPAMQAGLEYNYAYYPVVFSSEQALLKAFAKLAEHGIHARRYFYPSLNRLPYVKGQSCPVSEDISHRVACLPLFPNLPAETAERIARLVLES